MPTLIIILSVVGTLLLLLVIGIIVSYNKTSRIKTMALEAFSTMDVYLEKRWDLLPKMLDVVKGYTKHEYNTLVDTLKNRNYGILGSNEKIDENIKISKEIPSILSVFEQYPGLKASKGFSELLDEIRKIEDEIANARKYYNGVVRVYDTRLVVFPSNIIAKMFHFEKMSMYEASNREDVKL